MKPRSLTKKQAAQYVGLSVDTISRAINSGDLPAYRPIIDSREVTTDLVLVADLEQWAYPGLKTK